MAKDRNEISRRIDEAFAADWPQLNRLLGRVVPRPVIRSIYRFGYITGARDESRLAAAGPAPAPAADERRELLTAFGEVEAR